MKLFARPQDDLVWKIEGNPSLFEFDLGLNESHFPLEDEMHFHSLAAALAHFTQEVWPKFPNAKALLYRGSADFSKNFLWTEKQEANFALWKEEMPQGEELHLKRLFCAMAFVTYFQMLAHKLPDELPLILSLNTQDCGTLAERLHLLSPERFEHFQLETDFSFHSSIGVCFPPDSECGKEALDSLDAFLRTHPTVRAVYETHLTEQWDGLDEIYILPDALTERGRRKLKGFEAAGGKILAIKDQREASCKETSLEPATPWASRS